MTTRRSEALPAGGNVSGGNKEMELTGDVDLDRARDHVLHGTMHARGEKRFTKLGDGQQVLLGGGTVSGGKQEMEETGAEDLDRNRAHVLRYKS
jgi:hypothetical protein